jgi:hypothetical protein
VTVDGQRGCAVDSVNPDGGSIIVEFELVGDVLTWIAQTLLDRSPRAFWRLSIHGHTFSRWC